MATLTTAQNTEMNDVTTPPQSENDYLTMVNDLKVQFNAKEKEWETKFRNLKQQKDLAIQIRKRTEEMCKKREKECEQTLKKVEKLDLTLYKTCTLCGMFHHKSNIGSYSVHGDWGPINKDDDFPLDEKMLCGACWYGAYLRATFTLSRLMLMYIDWDCVWLHVYPHPPKTLLGQLPHMESIMSIQKVNPPTE